MILLVDFGSQTAHLIARRVRDYGVNVKIVVPEDAYHSAIKLKPKGIILSGGPQSVYQEGAPTIDKRIFELEIPMLAICYGMQLAMKLLGGEVVGGKREYGPAVFRILSHETEITEGLPHLFTVWMSHGDSVESIAEGFVIVGNTSNVPFALVEDRKRKIIGTLFHPEVEHTENGLEILKNFVKFCGIKMDKHEIDAEEIVSEIKAEVGDSYVIGAISGGVDSTVAGALTAKAIGKKFIPVYVDNGLMRDENKANVKKIFEMYGVKAIIVECSEEMLRRLENIKDPEEKRKLIGGFYIEIFEREMNKLKEKGISVKYLMQGTIYSDVIESKGTKHADKIKSHHNVGGLPEKMHLKLIEPVRGFYKDEVRKIGLNLGIPKEFILKQPFPGPGYAVRIRGEITRERLLQIKIADVILLEELSKEGLFDNVFMSFPVMTGAESVAVKGDGRFFGEVIALRIVESRDVMTAVWSRVPYEILQKISSRIVNEVPNISRVVYDISTKPPATMEWE